MNIFVIYSKTILMIINVIVNYKFFCKI